MHSDECKTTESGKRTFGVGKLALGAFLLVGISGTALAQNMIVRSVGPSAKSYPAGKKLAGSARLSLKKLDRVTILTKSGTRVLKGPGTFSVSGSRTARTTATRRIAGFISNRGGSRARTGAVRSAGTPVIVAAPKNPNLWFLDVNQGGKFCVANPNALVLWRPDYTGSASASIVDQESGGVTKVEWRKGNPLKAWPKLEAPVTSGASYRLIGSNVEKSVKVNFVILNNVPNSLDEAAAVLIENGCNSQLDLLVDTLDTGSNSTG